MRIYNFHNIKHIKVVYVKNNSRVNWGLFSVPRKWQNDGKEVFISTECQSQTFIIEENLKPEIREQRVSSAICPSRLQYLTPEMIQE